MKILLLKLLFELCIWCSANLLAVYIIFYLYRIVIFFSYPTSCKIDFD